MIISIVYFSTRCACSSESLTSSRRVCFALLAVKEEADSLGWLSSLGRGMFDVDGLDSEKVGIGWGLFLGVPRCVPVADILEYYVCLDYVGNLSIQM